MARVTVIITTYNRKDLLKRAIKSVLNQSLQDFELIVVDDCSPQDIEGYVKSFGDPRIKFFKTEKNFGNDSQPKNIGIKNATSDLVTFLDDDDEYRTDALKILTKYITEANVDVVYGDYMIDGKPGWSLEFSASQLNQFNYISMCVACVKKSSLLAIGGFDEDVPRFKDWNLWIRLQKNGADFLHVPIMVTTVHSQETSNSGKYKADTDPNTGRYLPTFFNPADCLIYPKNTSIGPKKPLKVAIYTLTMNRLAYTKQMYKSICNLAGYPFDWFVIDQGSKDGTVEWIKSLTRDQEVLHKGFTSENPIIQAREKLKYKLYEDNVGLAKGWNNIVDFIKSEGDYDIIVKIDNDAEIITDGFLKAMVDVFERNKKVILSPYVEGLDGSPGGVLRQRASGESPYMMINDYVLGIVPNLGGIVFATPIDLWKNWKFDELYEGNKDYILSLYAGKNGYLLFYMEEFRVWHIDGTKGQHAKFPDYFKGRKDFVAEDDKEPVNTAFDGDARDMLENGAELNYVKDPEIEYPEEDPEEKPDIPF